MQRAKLVPFVLLVALVDLSSSLLPLNAASSNRMRTPSALLRHLKPVHTRRSTANHLLLNRASTFPNVRSSTARFTSAAAPNFPPMPAKENVDKEGSMKGSTPPPDYTPYERWVRRLYMTNLFHPVKLGLQNIEQLHEAMGSPMDAKTRAVVHIAGTNGKGSVALKIAKSIEASNPELSVGLFCSPHVSSFRERMQVNGELIPEDEVVQLLPRIYKLCEEHDIPATFFEITTALAFGFFDARKTDVVVLETGLGGRLDATNVITSPAVTVITSIGLEHTRILGETIPEIALEKGGIMKPGRPVLVGPNVPHDVLRQCAKDKGAGPYYTCDDVLGPPVDLTEQDLADYDVENGRIAAAAIELLQKSHSHIVGTINEAAVKAGTSVRPPCRFETVECDNGATVILDVAHNPPAMDYLVRKLQTTYPEASFRIVVGMSSDKDLALCGKSVMTAVQNKTDRIHFVQAAHPRAATLEAILEATGLTDAHYDLEHRSVSRQIEQAAELAVANKETLVVCGSVFLMAEAREALGFDEPRDSDYIAEVAGAGVRHGQENFGNTAAATSK